MLAGKICFYHCFVFVIELVFINIYGARSSIKTYSLNIFHMMSNHAWTTSTWIQFGTNYLSLLPKTKLFILSNYTEWLMIIAGYCVVCLKARQISYSKSLFYYQIHVKLEHACTCKCTEMVTFTRYVPKYLTKWKHFVFLCICHC